MSRVRSVSALELRAKPAAESAAGCRLRHGKGRGPDWFSKRRRTAVFVMGCFWHRCPLHGSVPASNRDYWARKLARNAERDAEQAEALEAKGWKIIVLWEHDLAEKKTSRKPVPRRILHAEAEMEYTSCEEYGHLYERDEETGRLSDCCSDCGEVSKSEPS